MLAFALIAFSGILAASFIALYFAIRRSADGFEDEAGFHQIAAHSDGSVVEANCVTDHLPIEC